MINKTIAIIKTTIFININVPEKNRTYKFIINKTNWTEVSDRPVCKMCKILKQIMQNDKFQYCSFSTNLPPYLLKMEGQIQFF